ARVPSRARPRGRCRPPPPAAPAPRPSAPAAGTAPAEPAAQPAASRSRCPWPRSPPAAGRPARADPRRHRTHQAYRTQSEHAQPLPKGSSTPCHVPRNVLAEPGSGPSGSGRDGRLNLGELLGGAELNELGTLFGFWRVTGCHVEGVAGFKGLFAVGVADDYAAIEHVAPVRA